MSHRSGMADAKMAAPASEENTMPFTVTSQGPGWEFLKALCQQFNEMSPHVVKLTRADSEPQEVVVIAGAPDGLVTAGYDDATDTDDGQITKIPYSEITALELY